MRPRPERTLWLGWFAHFAVRCAERDKAGKVQLSLSDFATQETKIKLWPHELIVNRWSWPHISKNVQFSFASFRNELWRRRTKNYVYNENSKQIRKSVLTTFEVLFMQNAKQIIVEKVTKTASKHQFWGGFWSEWGDSNSRHLAPQNMSVLSNRAFVPCLTLSYAPPVPL